MDGQGVFSRVLQQYFCPRIVAPISNRYKAMSFEIALALVLPVEDIDESCIESYFFALLARLSEGSLDDAGQ
jgi:hypothetical protein